VNTLDKILIEFLETMAWLRQCDEHEPTTSFELRMHVARCLLRTFVFIVGAVVLFLVAVHLLQAV